MATPRVTIDALPEQATPEDTNLIVVQDADTTKKMTLATLATMPSTELAAHLTDTSDAHDASAISTTTSGAGIDSTTVQGQLGQLATLANTAGTSVADHVADTTAHTAAAIVADPHPGVTATDVQGQLEELSTALSVKDVVWVGPDAPVDPVVEMWWDSNAESAYLPTVQAPPYIDVRSYGAVGDGVTNDRNAIQAAIDAAEAVGGGVVMLPVGSYLIGSALDPISEPISIIGAGQGLAAAGATAATVLNFAAGIPGFVFGLNTGGSTVRGIYMKSASTIAGTDDGILLQSGRNHISDLIIEGFGRHAIHADSSGPENCNLNYIEHVRALANKGDGFHLVGSDCNSIRLIGCSAVANTGWGFYLDACATCFVANPHTDANGLGAHYDRGNSNHYYDVYAEGSATFQIAATSSYGVIVNGFYAAPTIVADLSASTSWTIINGGIFRRQLKIAALPSDPTPNIFKFGVNSPNNGDFHLNNESLAQRVLWVHRTTGDVTIEKVLSITGALDHNGTTVGFYGATPVVKAASPGTATGTDAAVLNAVVTALRNLGLVT